IYSLGPANTDAQKPPRTSELVTIIFFMVITLVLVLKAVLTDDA
ncbi:MAG: hypothetical protein RIR21_482, partial [Pseudomonadota bacterium]